MGLAGQERLVDGERSGPEDADICRDAVARLQGDAVAGDQVFGRNGRITAVPPHLCVDPEHLLQGCCAPLRPHLLECSDDRVDQDDDEDEDRVGEIGEEKGDDPGRKEDVDERARELAEEDLKDRRRPPLREGVCPEDFPPPGNLGVREAFRRRCKLPGCFIRRKGVPFRRPRFVGGEGGGCHRRIIVPYFHRTGHRRAGR